MSLVCWNVPDWLAPASGAQEAATQTAQAAGESASKAAETANQLGLGGSATTTAFIAGMFLGVRLMAEFLSRMAASLESSGGEGGEGGKGAEEVPKWVWLMIGLMARATAIAGMPKAYTKHMEQKKRPKPRAKSDEPAHADTNDVGKLVKVNVSGRSVIGRLTRYSDSMCVVRSYTSNEVMTAKPTDIYKLD